MKSTLRSLGFALTLGGWLAGFGAGCGDATIEAERQHATERAGRFELFLGEDAQHYFQLLAGNGTQLLRSEGYVSLAGARGGIESVQRNAVSAESFEVLPARDGEYYFNLVAANHEIIATSSETYASRGGAEAAVATVVRVAARAESSQLGAGGARFESFQGADQQTYFRLRAQNGEIVLQSEGYASPARAEAGIASVKAAGTEPGHYEVLAAQNGQHYFRLRAQNGEIIGRGELYVSQYNAERGAETVRRALRELTGVAASDDDIRAAAEAAAEGLLYTSEGDYPYRWVRAELDGASITEQLVRDELAPFVDGDSDADKPLAELYAMAATWDEWRTDPASCAAERDDEYAYEMCVKQAALDLVLGENLTDLQVFYFGAHGAPGRVDGVAVSIIVVGLTPEGNLAGVRTIAIWT